MQIVRKVGGNLDLMRLESCVYLENISRKRCLGLDARRFLSREYLEKIKLVEFDQFGIEVFLFSASDLVSG